ncbi:c-type cytochrome [Endozoicomonas ascidiicola]|uniref:c-type cytochrome n=1 Tax=Endozoicomonas ascidiicola TaxID=1698521 RepID=UPI00082AC2B8|nr:c-type cytochrome [Endozoicomonas ascidiicola]
MRALILLVGGLFASLVFAKPAADLDSTTRSEISERIAPVGSVCLTGEECASAAGVVASTSTGPRSGDAIYGQYCIACHSTGLLGAPKTNDAAAWQAAEQKAGGFSSLLSNAINGIKSMPPRGTCMDCSDEEIGVAIEFMSGLKP